MGIDFTIHWDKFDEKMKKEMYNIMETFCVNSFSIDNLHPAFRQSLNSIDCFYWDKVKEWCTTSDRNEVRIYFVTACVAIRYLLSSGTSSRIESAFSTMKLLSTSTRANMSTDRVVSEFIIRQAQGQIWSEKCEKARTSRKRAVVSPTVNSNGDIVNAFSEENLRDNENTVEVESCLVNVSEEPQSLDDVKHTGWLPEPCATTVSFW